MTSEKSWRLPGRFRAIVASRRVYGDLCALPKAHMCRECPVRAKRRDAGHWQLEVFGRQLGINSATLGKPVMPLSVLGVDDLDV